ncbi:MAG: MATE family efflux transporter [Sphaerochaetaceae bacterium]
MIEQLLAVSIGMADTVMIASEGEAAVSSIALVDSLNLLFIQLISALATGGAVVVAQYLGQKEGRKAGDAAKQLIYSSTLLTLVIMVLSLVFQRPVLKMVFGSIEDQVMSNCHTYFTITIISFPFLALYNAGAALFRSMGNSKISMKVSLGMNIINIVGNAVLIYVCHLGVAGAAISTLVSRMVSAIVMLVLLGKRNDRISIDGLIRFKLEWPMIKRILRIGIPSGIENSLFQVGKVLVQSLIAGFGTASIAANAIANSLAGFISIPGSAIGLAAITVIGQCMGAGDHEQAEMNAKRLMKIVYILMIILGALLFILTEPMVHLFNLGVESSTMAIELLRILYILNAAIWPLSFTLPQVLRASGDARFTMLVSVLSMWIFRIGFSFLLGAYMGLGLLGVWYAMFIDWAVRSICFTVRFRHGRWKQKKVI